MKMTNINDLGIVYTSDLLIIGGGIGGLAAAIKAKENNKDLDVLVVDKGAIGWSGQAAKAGNGILGRAPDQSVEEFMEYSIRTFGEYLNDQDYLREHYTTIPDSLEALTRWGVNISRNPDGSVKLFRMENNLWSHAGIELRNIKSLRKHALRIGVRLLSFVQIFELLTDGGRVIGGVGFDIHYMKYHIFNAKAVAIATHGAHFKKMGGMFMGYGNGLAAAYRVGAQMRNAEFSTEVDVVSRAIYTPIYGVCNLIHNRNGENISAKYAPDRVEVDFDLVLGMYKEVQEGRGPCYADLAHPDPVRIQVGGQEPEFQRIWPDKHHWIDYVEKKSAKYGRPLSDEPEVTVRMQLQAECLAVDLEQRTNVEGLWGTGKVTSMGCSYIGFVRGDGLGFAIQTGLRTADSMTKYAGGADLGRIDPDQVKAHKEKIYAPLHRDTTRKSQEIFGRIEDYAFHVDVMVAKTDRSIRRVLAQIDEMRDIVPLLSATDAHTLAKCHEAADSLLCLEFIFRAALMRKESRGGRYRHYREDYPVRDDGNWLKWIVIQKGVDDRMELFTQDVPIDRYKYRPDGHQTHTK
jgi:succinate dehydrogenase/fumarate reductase flavoprotein subunit